jgi:hypothetical protein
MSFFGSFYLKNQKSDKQGGLFMKKRNIVLTVAAALTVAAGAGAIAYNVVTTQKQMKGYDKQVSFKGECREI